MKRLRYIVVFLLLLSACGFSVRGQALSQTALVGTWGLKQTALKSAGSKAFWFTFKEPRFMVYTFAPDGTWELETKSSEPRTNKRGIYSIKGKKVVLTVNDGSKFDEWKVEVVDNGNTLNAEGDKLKMQLIRLPERP